MHTLQFRLLAYNAVEWVSNLHIFESSQNEIRLALALVFMSVSNFNFFTRIFLYLFSFVFIKFRSTNIDRFAWPAPFICFPDTLLPIQNFCHS